MTRDSLRHARRLGFLCALAATFALLRAASDTRGADWPQWRGPGRDAKVTDFKAPKSWPKELKQQWKITVGDGVATPALVGDKLYVFSREGGAEVIRCLEAASNKEVWKDKYDVEYKGKGDTQFQGPRASPTVADGKVVTFGLNGTLSCLNAATGEKLWRVETGAWPMFHASCSPLVVDKTVVVQVGSEGSGGVTAYELENGNIKWKWTDEGPAYSSPALMTVGDTKMVVAETSKSVVGIGLTDGKTKWKTPFAVMGKGGGGGGYNAATPIVEGQTVIISGSNRGTKAIKVEKSGDEFKTKEEWNNKENSVLFNTPVVKNGLIFGLTSSDTLFCITADGKTGWTAPVGKGGGRPGYGSVVDAGPVLFALTPRAQLTVFEPSDKDYKELASYSVGSGTYAYPIVTGNRIYIKDKDSLALYTVE